MMTIEEYKKKLQELREKRDYHHKEYIRLMEEMDRLETDRKVPEYLIGKYITVDRRDKGGYLEYFRVESYETRPRGVSLHGKGFAVSDITNNYINVYGTLTLWWEDISLPKEISADAFYNAFDEATNKIKFDLTLPYQESRKADPFLFKNKMLNGEFKIKLED